MSSELFNVDGNNFTLNLGNRITNPSASILPNKPRKRTAVIDFDEVLVNIAYKWAKRVFEDKAFADLITPSHKEIYDIDINLRHLFYLEKWLGIKDKELVQKYYSYYFDDPTFYDDIEPTAFYHSLTNCISADIFKEIHIVTKCGYNLDSPCNISKKRKLVELFKNVPKSFPLHFHFLKAEESKVDFVNNNNIQCDLFVDDSLENVETFIKDIKGYNLEIMMPLLGYNHQLSSDLSETIIEKQIKVTYFHNIQNLNKEEMDVVVKEIFSKS